MTSAAFLIAAALVAATPANAAGPQMRTNITTASRTLMLGDVVDLSALPAEVRKAAQALVLGRFGPGETQMSFTYGQVIGRARAMMPALGPWLTGDRSRVIQVSRTLVGGPAAGTAPAACVSLARPLAAGESPAASDLVSAACDAASARQAFRYRTDDRTLRATGNLSAGVVVAAPPFLPDLVAPGQKVRIRATIGAVTIERDVEALQAAGPGRSLFVRDLAGEVFSVNFSDLAP